MTPPSLDQLDQLLDLMDLSIYWGIKELYELVQVRIIDLKLISPVTYEEGAS